MEDQEKLLRTAVELGKLLTSVLVYGNWQVSMQLGKAERVKFS